MVLLQNINMQTIGSTSKRKRKLDYVGPENQLVVSCFDTPKKIAPKQREHRVFVGGHGNTDWDRWMEGFEGIAAAKEEHEPTTDEECTPVDIDWASTDESESNSVDGQEDAPSSSREHKKNLLRMKELNADTRSLKERLSRQSTSAFRMRAVTKTGSLQHSGRIPAGCGRHREQVPRRSSRAAGEGTQWDSADMSISDYDSDTEENEEFEKPTNNEDIVKTTDSLSPVIGSLTPSMSQSPLPPDETAANRSKISDWVKCLQWQDTTPEKQSDIMEESNVADSTKKKPKYIRHGLADQLQRLVAREKSAVAFWLHKLTTARTATPATAGATTTSGATTTAAGATTTSEATTTTGAVFDSKVLSVKVLKLRKEYSLLVAECCYLHSSSEPGDNDNVVVLFTNSSKVMHGSTVNIHPPWQSLDTGGRKVILCTHFHEVFPHEAPTITQHTTSSTLLATWKCPCEQDRSLDPLACPAAEFPCSTAARTGKSAAGDSVSCLSHVPASLTGVHTDQSHKLVTVSGNETASHCSPGLSILDSVEKQGGCTTASVGFTAAVQRVFSHCPVGGAGRLASRAVSWSLLVQDTYGAVCHIEVTDRLVERAPWIEILHSGEGRVYNFTGLRLVRRTSRARCAGLFGVIDAIWTTTAMLRHEDVSQESSVGSEPITFTEPPGFCYHLAAVWPESVCSLSHATPRSPCLYNPLRHTPLAALDGAHGRVNLLARVFCHIHDVSSPSVDGIHSVIYVTDASWGDSGRRGERRYMCVLVKQTCCLPDGPWLTTDSGTGVVIFKDLLSHQPGRCYFDPYSRLYDTTREETLTRFSLAAADVTAVGMATFKPPPMALDVHTYDLVKLEGRITSVDESTAYSWIECDVCRSDKLAADGSSRGTVRCSQCERSVEHPIAKVNLDVFVSCSQLRDVVVKVKLLQPTIEKLLPTHKDDEGYDVESVLGNDLGPLTCVVVSVTKRKDSGHFVLQELTTRSHPI